MTWTLFSARKLSLVIASHRYDSSNSLAPVYSNPATPRHASLLCLRNLHSSRSDIFWNTFLLAQAAQPLFELFSCNTPGSVHVPERSRVLQVREVGKSVIVLDDFGLDQMHISGLSTALSRYHNPLGRY